MLWSILVLFLLSACARGPTEVDHAADTCSRPDGSVVECGRGAAASQQLDRDDALQQPGQVQNRGAVETTFGSPSR